MYYRRRNRKTLLKTILNTLRKHKKDYVVYQITIGEILYVGSTSNYSLRMNQHLQSLKIGQHHNSKLQHAYLTHRLFDSKILFQSSTFFLKKRFRMEQRFINLISNSNEALAAKTVSYTFRELVMDCIDLVF